LVQSTVEKLSATRVKIAITVTPDELKPSIDHAYKHIAESVNIPGFRKGKVPPPIIDQRVGRAEVLNHAVSEGLDTFYREAVADQKLRTLGRPSADITEWPSAEGLLGRPAGDDRGGCPPRVRPAEVRRPHDRGRRGRRHPRRGRGRAGEPAQPLRHARDGGSSGGEGRLRAARPGGDRRRQHSRHGQLDLVRARLGRADRGHRRRGRDAHRGREDHLRVEAARRRPRGRDRADRGHRAVGEGARAARGRR